MADTKLKIKEVTYKEVYYADLEDFIIESFDLKMIERSYGKGHSYKERPYSVISAMESSNDTYHTIHLQKPDPSDYWEEEKKGIEEWAANNGPVEKEESWGKYHYEPHPSALLEYLCEKGKVEEGVYLVHVSW